MQSDKELLMLAAKAAGMAHPAYMQRASRDGINQGPIGPLWNSLKDNGDCAQLESACGVELKWMDDAVRAWKDIEDEPHFVTAIEFYDDHGGDKNKARRYASTRAAASLAQQGVSK